jgi:hypothetical protein
VPSRPGSGTDLSPFIESCTGTAFERTPAVRRGQTQSRDGPGHGPWDRFLRCLRFFTNGGVREYQFDSPPVFTEFHETELEAVLRINRCKQLGASLVLRKYLQLFWLVDPPEPGRVAHQWEIHSHGLSPGRRVTVWHGVTGSPLVEAFADASGRVDVSLFVPPGERTESLVVGLDGAPFPTSAELHAPTLGADEATGVQLAVRQTVLTPIATLDLDAPVTEIGFAGADTRGRLLVRTADGESQVHCFDAPEPAARAWGRLDSVDPPRGQQGQVTWRGGQRRFTMLSDISGRLEVVADYGGRSAFDLATSRDGLLAQASPDGTQVMVYRRGMPRESNPLEWMPEDESEPVGVRPRPGG